MGDTIVSAITKDHYRYGLLNLLRRKKGNGLYNHEHNISVLEIDLLAKIALVSCSIKNMIL